MNTEIKEVFEAALLHAKDIDFDSKWHNGTGYFDNATKVDLEAGEMRKSVDENGRRLIIIGLPKPYKSLVVFERYSPKDDSYAIVRNTGGRYACHRSSVIKVMLGDGALSADQVMIAVGHYHKEHILCENIGVILSEFVEDCTTNADMPTD